MGIKRVLALRAVGIAAVAVTLATAAALTGCTPAGAPDTAATSVPVTPQPGITTPVPAPDGGTLTETVAPQEGGATTEVGLDETAELSDGVEITVAEVESLDVAAETPGEIAGPAVALTLDVVNNGSTTIDLSTAMVGLTGSDNSLGLPTTSTPFAPFTGEVAPGASATGTYVFLLPADERDALSVTVEHVAGAPIALFTGDTTKESR